MNVKFVSSILLSICGSTLHVLASEEKYVTCGSAIKLSHIESGGNFFLMSDEKQLQSGSGQQLVTAAEDNNNPQNSLWQIREAYGEPLCMTGEPIKCGDALRLTHHTTNNNLHTHGIKSPLSGQHEVTGFGNGQGEGDSGDNWVLTCEGGKYWLRNTPVQFKSVATGRFLGASSTIKFNEQNCGRGCPILNHLEVFARSSGTDKYTRWKTENGVYLYK